MKVKDILSVIYINLGVTSFESITIEQYNLFQNDTSVKSHIDFEEDSLFEEFHKYLSELFKDSKRCVYRPTAVKILNNAYYLSLQYKTKALNITIASKNEK